MADHSIPHFHNTPGVASVRIGTHKFMCMGALPPFDHPHIFLDLGSDTEVVCPYCSTLYKYDAGLQPGAADPAACALTQEAA